MTDMDPIVPTLEETCGGVVLRHMWHNWSCPVMFRDWVNSGDMNIHPGVLLSVLRSPSAPGENPRPWGNALIHFAWTTFYHCCRPDMEPPLAVLVQEAKDIDRSITRTTEDHYTFGDVDEVMGRCLLLANLFKDQGLRSIRLDEVTQDPWLSMAVWGATMGSWVQVGEGQKWVVPDHQILIDRWLQTSPEFPQKFSLESLTGDEFSILTRIVDHFIVPIPEHILTLPLEERDQRLEEFFAGQALEEIRWNVTGITDAILSNL